MIKPLSAGKFKLSLDLCHKERHCVTRKIYLFIVRNLLKFSFYLEDLVFKFVVFINRVHLPAAQVII